MPIARQKLKHFPIMDQDVLHNRVHTFGHGRLTVIELETKDGLIGIGQCRMSDEDMKNPNFRPDMDHAMRTARWRAAESIRLQKKGKPLHDPLMR